MTMAISSFIENKMTRGNFLFGEAVGYLALAKTASYSLLTTDNFVGVGVTTADATFTLPTAGIANGNSFIICDRAGTNNQIKIVGQGGETIDGAATYLLKPFETIEVAPYGSNWKIVRASGLVSQVTLTGASPTVKRPYDIVFVTTYTSTDVTVSIHSDLTVYGLVVSPMIFKDLSGNANAGKIVLTPVTGNIDGASTLNIISSYGSVSLFAKSSNLYSSAGIVSQTNRLAKTASYQLSVLDNYIAVGTVTADATFTLPTAGIAAKKNYIIKDEAGTAGYSIAIIGESGETIDGQARLIIKPFEAIEVIPDGTNWKVLRRSGLLSQTTLTGTSPTIVRHFDVVFVTTYTSAAVGVAIHSDLVAFGLLDGIMAFKDVSGYAATNAATMTPASGTVDGAANVAISSNFGKVNVMGNGTNLFTI